MRHTTVAIVALGLLGCSGGERPPQQEADSAAGTLTIAVPDSMVPDSAVVVAVSIHAVPAAAPGDTVVVGMVQEVGAMPLTQLVVQTTTGDGPRSVGVRGPMRREVENLVGAEVRIWGRPVANQPPSPPRAVEVTGYEVLSVGGSVPLVGTLIEENGAFYLVSGTDRLALDPVPENLRDVPGAKVWVVGRREDGTMHVGSFGIIRRPE